jgi:hypothetical protein
VPGPDPTHWLHRLTASEWLTAADAELAQAQAAFARRAARPGVTYARRSAGMAWNALMAKSTLDFNERFGRSYMEHIIALAEDDGALPEEIRAAARLLRDTPPRPPDLVSLRPDLGPVEAARRILAYVRARVDEAGLRPA